MCATSASRPLTVAVGSQYTASSAQPSSSSLRLAASSVSFHAAPYAVTTSFTPTTSSRGWSGPVSSCQCAQELLAVGAVRRLVPPAAAQLEHPLRDTRHREYVVGRLQQPTDTQPRAQHFTVLACRGVPGTGELPHLVGLVRLSGELRVHLREPRSVIAERRAVPRLDGRCRRCCEAPGELARRIEHVATHCIAKRYRVEKADRRAPAQRRIGSRPSVTDRHDACGYG